MDTPRPGDLIVVASGSGYQVLCAGTPNVPIIAEGSLGGLEEALVFAGTRAQTLGVEVWVATEQGACERIV